MHTLIFFYDANCALCAKEVRHLMRWDRDHKILFENIKAADFSVRYPNINPVEADRKLHAIYRDKFVLKGLDATYAAWRLAGKGHWIAWMRRWPFRPLCDVGYLVFARYRKPLSRLLSGVKCDTQCGD